MPTTRRILARLAGSVVAATLLVPVAGRALRSNGDAAKGNAVLAENSLDGDADWGTRSLDQYAAARAAVDEDAVDRTEADRGGAGGVVARANTTGWSNPKQVSGYASAQSVDQGQPISFSISSTLARYDVEIYRQGWYGGDGARQVYRQTGLVGTDYGVPNPDPATGRIEANWPVALTVTPDSTWTSGVYLVTLLANGGVDPISYIPFVVRDDVEPRHDPVPGRLLDLPGLQRLGRQEPLRLQLDRRRRPAHRDAPRRQGLVQLRPTRATRAPACSSPVTSSWSTASSARATTSPTPRARTWRPRPASGEPRHVPLGLPRRVLVVEHAQQLRGAPARPASTSPSSRINNIYWQMRSGAVLHGPGRTARDRLQGRCPTRWRTADHAVAGERCCSATRPSTARRTRSSARCSRTPTASGTCATLGRDQRLELDLRRHGPGRRATTSRASSGYEWDRTYPGTPRRPGDAVELAHARATGIDGVQEASIYTYAERRHRVQRRHELLAVLPRRATDRRRRSITADARVQRMTRNVLANMRSPPSGGGPPTTTAPTTTTTTAPTTTTTTAPTTTTTAPTTTTTAPTTTTTAPHDHDHDDGADHDDDGADARPRRPAHDHDDDPSTTTTTHHGDDHDHDDGADDHDDGAGGGDVLPGHQLQRSGAEGGRQPVGGQRLGERASPRTAGPCRGRAAGCRRRPTPPGPRC